jgi:glycosyltransferase involved in cell wall biosynthesis
MSVSNIQQKIGKKLVIISHTEHFLSDRKIMGWAPTINEIDYLSQYWDVIVHVACLHSTIAPPSAIPYKNANIKFVSLPPYGGKQLIDKLSILYKMPQILNTVQKELYDADHVQLRLPTSMGLYLLPYFTWFRERDFLFWVKYAGNWEQENPPVAYKIQKWFLRNNFMNANVTINGKWDNQPKHCKTFENPCLTASQQEQGDIATFTKVFLPPYKMVFIGRLDKSKGVHRILEALDEIDLSKIKEIVFIGNGDLFEDCTRASLRDDVNIRVLGFLSTNDVHKELVDTHFLMLPSDSEGFPKVVAEAANYGCIPIVSEVSCIGHYINESNGYLWDMKSNFSFANMINEAINNKSAILENQKIEVRQFSTLFTFERYFYKLKTMIENEIT